MRYRLARPGPACVVISIRHPAQAFVQQDGTCQHQRPARGADGRQSGNRGCKQSQLNCESTPDCKRSRHGARRQPTTGLPPTVPGTRAASPVGILQLHAPNTLPAPAVPRPGNDPLRHSFAGMPSHARANFIAVVPLRSDACRKRTGAASAAVRAPHALVPAPPAARQYPAAGRSDGRPRPHRYRWHARHGR